MASPGPTPFAEALGTGLAALRTWRGWRQDDVAAAARAGGLVRWTAATVAHVERGRRELGLEELLLLSVALDVPALSMLDLAASRVRLMAGRADGDPPADVRASWVAWALSAGSEGEHPALMREPTGLLAAPAMPPTPSDAERAAAARLGVEPEAVRGASRELRRAGQWALPTLDAERERRASEGGPHSAAVLRARRGHATRVLVADLATHLHQV